MAGTGVDIAWGVGYYSRGEVSLPKLRVYVDTSVFGGVEDEEFAVASRRFFDQVGAGGLAVLISGVR